PANYNQAVRLRVWGGFENCGRRELLWETEAIAPAQWKQYEMALRPTQSFTHILLEAEYLNPYSPPYNGNILLDHASPLLPIGCDSPNPERPPLEAVEAPKLEDLRALRAYLAEQGLQLRFTVTGAGIERHLFADAAGNAQQVNKYLWLMGRALSQFPGTEVLIAVGGESDFVLQERLMHFDYTLQAAGLSPQQYHLRPRKRSDEKKEWLWPVEKVDYLIQLVQK
ncbi:MAG: hypothetical protein KDC66_11150, partial [Phaeodactylibacter sp.]|nr:hypothetical protein [Phaeodactylibacter sp.]